jgi:transcriptional regulator with XRE-family HTH domain
MDALRIVWPDRRRFNRGPVGRALGEVLRKARKARGYTLDDVAQRVGLDYQYTSFLERGLRAPSIAIVFAFAKALRMKPEEIVRQTRLTLARHQRLQSRACLRSPTPLRWKPPRR